MLYREKRSRSILVAASSAYRVFLLGLLSVLQDQLESEQFEAVLEETGRRLARESGLPITADFQTSLTRAMAAANSLGASTEAIPDGDATLVRNYSCPVAGAVRKTPCMCKALAAFFSEATSRPASEQCLREGRLLCQYRIG